jgi:Peptidase S24-like
VTCRRFAYGVPVYEVKPSYIARPRQSSCASHREAAETELVEGIQIGRHMKAGEWDHNFLWVDVLGDSLEPDVRRGATALVDADATPAECDLWYEEREGKQVFGHLERRGDGFRLASDLDPDGARVGSLEVKGKVVEFYQPVARS